MIALDGADGALLDRWTTDGSLPHLAALRKSGTAKYLSAENGVTDDSLWASFQYGAGPGFHGRYHYMKPGRRGKMRMAFRSETGWPAFWNQLSASGNRIAVFDVPKCGNPHPLNGIHLVDWLVHGRYFHSPVSFPAELAADVVEAFGAAPPSHCGDHHSVPEDKSVLEVIANLRKSVSMKRSAALHYFDKEAWDLFVVGFKEAHCASHAFWDLTDISHPDHDADRAVRLGDPIRIIMQDIDAAVGDLIEAVGADSSIAVFSTCLIQPNATLQHLMPTIVSCINRELCETRLHRRLRLAAEAFGFKSPERCEILPYNENCTALRVNPARRFGSGKSAAKEKSELVSRIADLLNDLLDSETCLPVLHEITRPSAENAGPRAYQLPDLLLIPNAGQIPKSVISNFFGKLEVDPPALRAGNHAPGGFVISSGIKPADFDAVHSMQDFATLATNNLSSKARL